MPVQDKCKYAYKEEYRMQKGWFLLKSALLAGTLVMPYNVAAEVPEESVQVEYTAADYEVPFFYDLESVTELEGECDCFR